MAKTVEKAIITVFEGKGKKKDEIKVMFNPTELSQNFEAKWTEENSKLNFGGTTKQDLSVTLFFDSYEKGEDVRIHTKKISDTIQPSVPGKNTKRPPDCLFSWGKFRFYGVVTKIDQKFTMFLQNGIPVRAELSITFKQPLSYKDIEKSKGVEACRKMRIIKAGERLDWIAGEELKDAALWRKIAIENNIDDPLNFPTENIIGGTLIIPE